MPSTDQTAKGLQESASVGSGAPTAPQSLALVFGALVVGALTGLTGVAFLKALTVGLGLWADLTALLTRWPPVLGWLASASLVALAATAAAAMVKKWAPNAGGSGVPYVERILRTDEVPCHAHVLPVKFLGGLLALSSGMLLGREGPLVQMGSVIGERCGRLLGSIPGAWKALMMAGAGAGMATAFNAPVGGTLFVLEEVQRKVTPLAFLLAATATTASAWVQRAVFHYGPDFSFSLPTLPEASSIGLFALLGLVCGGLGTVYNHLLLALARPRKPLLPWPAQAALIGFIVGTAGWINPDWSGGGDALTQKLLSGASGGVLVLLAVRFLLGPLSYAAGTPGGLFAPVITLGALAGLAFSALPAAFLPDLAVPPTAFAVAGMAAFFTASIRAPLTGIVICLELTGGVDLFYSLLASCVGAFLVPTLLRNEPIYDALARK